MNPNAARLMDQLLAQAGPKGMTWETLHAELLKQDVPSHQIGQLITDYDRRGLINRRDGRLVLTRTERPDPPPDRTWKMKQGTRRSFITVMLREFPEGLSPQEVTDELHNRGVEASIQTVYSDLQDLARQGTVVAAGATSRRIYYHPELAPAEPDQQRRQRRQSLAKRLNELAQQLQQISREISEAQPR